MRVAAFIRHNQLVQLGIVQNASSTRFQKPNHFELVAITAKHRQARNESNERVVSLRSGL